MAAGSAGAAVLGQYDRPEPRVDVQASRWNPGSPIEITGSHFSPSEEVTVQFGGSVLATEDADGSGNFSLNAVVPATASPGNQLLTATGADSKRYAEYVFFVQAFNPWGEPSSYWSPVGTDLTFSGHRFANGETVDVLLDGNVVATGVANGQGEFNGAGPYKITCDKFGQNLAFTMEGQTSGATASFNSGVANWPLLTEPCVPGGEPEEPEQPEEPQEPALFSLQTDTLVTTLPGQSRWQALDWKGGDYDVCSFEVTADIPGASVVTYPSGQDSSYPATDRTLSKDELDFTAIRVRVDDDASGVLNVRIRVDYRTCDEGLNKSASFLAELPTNDPNNPVLGQVTTDLGTIQANQSTWVALAFRADGPGATDVRVTVGPLDGFSFRYPADGAYTTPSLDFGIESGTEDFVGVDLTANNVAPGVYVLPVKVTYGGDKSLETTVSFTVE